MFAQTLLLIMESQSELTVTPDSVGPTGAPTMSHSQPSQGSQGEVDLETSEIPKVESTTPFTSQASGTFDTATTETDSMFAGRESTEQSTDDEFVKKEYHNDPGEVNIHQFFPILDHTFNMPPHTAASRSDKEQLLAIVEEDSRSEQTGETAESRADTCQKESEGEGDQSADIWGKVSTDESGVNSRQQNDTFSIDGQEGVFSTAVDESSIEAAKQRNQTVFSNETWSGAPVQRQVGLVRIVTERAYEHYQKALENKESQDVLAVITCLNKAINLKTDDPMFYVERAEAYIELCDFQSAILNYKKACLLEPMNQAFFSRLAFVYYFHGQTLFDQRLYPEALESFSRASEMVPDNVGYHIRSITCLAALQRHGECLALVNKRLETDHDNPDLYIMRARLHEMFRNATLCYYDVKDALVLDPEHVEGKAMMDAVVTRGNNNKLQAMQLNIAGKHREALQKISTAIETNPSVADFHVLRGALHRKLNDFNAAIDDFLLALDKCDHNEENPVYMNAQRQLLLTYNDFAVECFGKSFYEEAIILLNKAIKGEKTEKSLYVNRGDCFFKQSELNFALQDYHQALELDGLDPAIKARISVIHNELGVQLYQDKNYHEAESKFTLAIQYNPQVGQYYLSRSRSKYMNENTAGARDDLLLGLLLAPNNEDVMSILSRLFPGKSVSDVINSGAAQAARLQLNNLVATNSPVRLNPLGPGSNLDTEYLSEKIAGEDQGNMAAAAVDTWETVGSRSASSFAMCLTEHEFYAEQVKEKRKVETQVKDALNNRKSLRYNGARIQPLPPPTSRPRYGTLQGRRQILTTAGDRKHKSSTGWKTFSLGLGGLANV